MISAEVIKAVERLLVERGYQPPPDQRLADYLADKLNISAHQTDVFLSTLNEGFDIEQAKAAAEIDELPHHSPLLSEIARAIGTTLGRLARSASQN